MPRYHSLLNTSSNTGGGIASVMSASEGTQDYGEKQLCSAETFRHALGVEIERYARYRRDFAIVLIRPRDFGNQQAQRQATVAASERALKLLRTCDIVTIFEENPFVVALLPETDADGARTVFERFDEQVVVQGAGWVLKASTYSEHAASIQHFLLWFNELLLSSDGTPSSSDGTPASRYAQLRYATSNVTGSWRDLSSAQ